MKISAKKSYWFTLQNLLKNWYINTNGGLNPFMMSWLKKCFKILWFTYLPIDLWWIKCHYLKQPFYGVSHCGGAGGIYYAGCLSNYSNIKNISLNKLIIHKINIEDNQVPLNSYIMYKFISNINIMFWVFIIHRISRVYLF